MSTCKRTLIALTAGTFLGFCGALSSGVLADRPSTLLHGEETGNRDRGSLPWQEASLFAEVYARIKRDYVEEVDDHTLMEKAIRGMVAALDPHSAYLDSQEFDEIRLSTMGSYPGVGIEVAASDGVVKVLRPIDGSPARRRPDRADRWHRCRRRRCARSGLPHAARHAARASRRSAAGSSPCHRS